MSSRDEREFSVRVDAKTPDRSLTGPVYAVRSPTGVLLRLAGRRVPLSREAARILARELKDAAEPE